MASRGTSIQMKENKLQINNSILKTTITYWVETRVFDKNEIYVFGVFMEIDAMLNTEKIVIIIIK